MFHTYFTTLYMYVNHWGYLPWSDGLCRVGMGSGGVRGHRHILLIGCLWLVDISIHEYCQLGRVSLRLLNY